MTTRGVRNNNPGNIRKGGDSWQGLAKEQPDAAFCTFTDPVWGIRAICRILLNYERAGIGCVAEVVSRWAPPSDQPRGAIETNAYIAVVARAVGVEALEQIEIDSAKVMFPMVKAIIAQENSGYAYPDPVIREAMRRAGVSDAPQKSLAKKVSGEALAGASLGLGVVAQAAEPAKAAADKLADFTGAPWIAHISTALLTLAGIAILATMAKKWIDHRRGL